jgi:hypothetical protein
MSDDPTLGGILGPLPAMPPAAAAAQQREARWEIVDAHRCTACGHLDTDGHRIVQHLRTHAPTQVDPVARDDRSTRVGEWGGD